MQISCRRGQDVVTGEHGIVEVQPPTRDAFARHRRYWIHRVEDQLAHLQAGECGLVAFSKAQAPDTCGAAMEVPFFRP